MRRGDIRKLLVLESLPKPVNFSGGPDLVSWLGTFTLERVLGTVPVEEGKKAIDATGRFTTASFRPNGQYIREMKRFGILPAFFDISRQPLDIFQTDQEYWKSLWPRPPSTAQ